MNLNCKIATIGLVTLTFFAKVEAQDPDSLGIISGDSLTLEKTFEKNLDSLSSLWYVGESTDTIEAVPDTEALFAQFSDSLLIDRLSKLPCVVELSYNTIVRRYVEMYLNKRSDLVENMLGLSNYYFPIFDEIFDYYGIPNELKYLSVIESALNPMAYSRARAVGLWQFMYGTGRMYGLTINSLVDERRDPIKSTYAAARFLSDLYKRYNDWTLALAAYNCGPGNVNKAIARSGGKRDYWEIYFYLPRETRGYVPAFVAANYVMNYYSAHNLKPKAVDFPFDNDTIMVTEQLHLEQIAKVLDIPVQKIRDMNPQYRYDIIPATITNPYSVRLPGDKVVSFVENEKTIFAYNDSVYFNSERFIATPTRSTNSDYIYEQPGSNMAKIYYTVKRGDNLGYISEKYKVRISDLRYWNNIRGNMIRSGQKLVIYVPKSKAAKYANVSQASDSKPANTSIYANSETGDYVYYTVQANDTLWGIAKKFPGVSDVEIMRLNNITNASKIKPGQKLKIRPN